MKYIIIADGNLEVAIIFDPLLNHKTMAGANKVISAGFCRIGAGQKVQVWGESVSLNIEHREEDAKIIQELIEPK